MEKIPVLHEVIVAIANECIAPEEMLVRFPLEEDVIPFIRRTDRIQHI